MANYQTYKQIQGDQALIANSVGPGQVTGVSTGVAQQFFLYNNNYWSVSNGGCCLNWTVPPLTTSVRFELTSGGGTGSIGACCSNGPSGGAGAYATKTLFAYKDFTPGSTSYTICAGGTSQCSCCRQCTGRACCGRRGCTSYVTGSGLSNFCAQGGAWGWHHCGGGCYSCVSPAQCNKCLQVCACWFGADFGIIGPSGGKHNNQYCLGTSRSWTGPGVGPWASSTNFNQDNCSRGNTHGCCKGQALFPGGGGLSPFTDGGCCWGGFGAAGLVVVSYWQ